MGATLTHVIVTGELCALIPALGARRVSVGFRFGVTCDDTGLVTRLELPHNGVAGTVPARLGALIHLMVLDLSNNSISGTLAEDPGVPEHGGRPGLEMIQDVNLGSNYISGKLPESFNSWKELQYLQLSSNRFSAIRNKFDGMRSLLRL